MHILFNFFTVSLASLIASLIYSTPNIQIYSIFKRVLCQGNKEEIFTFLDTAVAYFETLTVEDVRRYKRAGEVITKSRINPLLKSSRRAAFCGFIMDAIALKMMYKEYVEDLHLLSSISTYTLQQDVIEMFFQRIRSKCGYNSNPNVHQFKGAYRQLSTNIKIDISKNANCRYFDTQLPKTHYYSNVTTVSSKRAKFIPDLDALEDAIEQQQDEIPRRSI